MKKLISIVIAMVIAMLSFITAFTVYADEERTSEDINSFIYEVVELTQKYDKGKEFVAPEENELAQVQPFYAPNSEEVADSTEPEYTLQDFQTARLIVRADGNFDDFGALENISGFEDFHILQYESPEEAMEAYAELKAEKNVISVGSDLVIDGLQGDASEIITEDELNNDKYLCDWSHDRTQADRLLDYLETQNIPERKVVVALIDSGIDYHNKIFENRIEYSYFNSSSDGSPDDEFDSAEKSHGTTVSSVIIDNTPQNIKVSVYKVFNNSMKTTITQVSSAYLMAVSKNPDIINASLTHLDDEAGLIRACLLEAYSKNIPVFACVGNTGWHDMAQLPANMPETIAVSATDKDNTTVLWNSQTLNSDVSAPGQDIVVAISDNKYINWKGTSFSSPCAASLGAILKWTEPDITVDEIAFRLKSTSLDVKRYNDYLPSPNTNMDNHYSLQDGVGMIQFSSAFGLPELTEPVFSLEDKSYLSTQTCSIQCADKNATILYTTDGTYPALENANEYTEPFEVAQRTRIRAVAYYADGGYYSREVEITPRIQYTDDDEKFTVTNDGVITAYHGTVADLFVQDTIKGITITGIEDGAFDAPTLISLTLPKGVTEISENTFYKNKSLEYIRAEGVTEIGQSAFESSNIMYAEFPNAKVIGEAAFSSTKYFCYGDFENVELIEPYAFGESNIISFYGPSVTTIYDSIFAMNTRLERLYLPKCAEILPTVTGGLFDSCNNLTILEMKSVKDLSYVRFSGTTIVWANFPSLEIFDEYTFKNCSQLRTINLPCVLSIPNNAFSGENNPNLNPRTYNFDNVKTIGENAFGKYSTSRLELSHLESAKSLPQTEGCIIAMPSTFKKCNEKTVGRNYKVYGTKGTYAEEWANKNGHKFTEISQETAVLTQLPKQYTDADDVLTADVIGFNRTYQWYANTEDSNETGTPIEGATDREFNPADYLAAKYYYCVVTSTNVGYDPIEIRTGVTENMTLKPADYTAYNAAVEKANAIDRSLYQDLDALDTALSVDVSGLTVLEQNIVDEQTKAIETAINSLQYKPADYTDYDKAVEQAKSIDRSLYKDLTALDEALKTDVSGKNITEQAVVDKQAKAIEEAINALKYKPADYTEVEKAIAAIPDDLSIYTDESVNTLNEVVNAVDDSLNITQQATVDGYAQAIIDAVNALELKPIEPPVTEEPTKPDATKPGVPEGTTKPSVPEESTTLPNSQKTDIPNTGGGVPVSYTVALLTLLSACIYITSRKRIS